jgi:predicted AAA+ superfamily ATPase
LSQQQNQVELDQNLEQFLVYGFYPDVITSKTKDRKVEYLLDLVHSYLLKDILSLENVKSPKILLDLLRMLAFQIGSEVSLNELSNGLGVDVKTVGRYIDLLEKSFIIISLGGFSRNLRNEITSKKKYYFLDNGIRNAVINAFNPLSTRNDTGALWENFIIIERLKKKTYQRIYSNDYFWRTYSKQEIDLIEERDGKLFPFEIKWKKQTYKPPTEWVNNYPDDKVTLITRENYLKFVL